MKQDNNNLYVPTQPQLGPTKLPQTLPPHSNFLLNLSHRLILIILFHNQADYTVLYNSNFRSGSTHLHYCTSKLFSTTVGSIQVFIGLETIFLYKIPLPTTIYSHLNRINCTIKENQLFSFNILVQVQVKLGSNTWKTWPSPHNFLGVSTNTNQSFIAFKMFV